MVELSGRRRKKMAKKVVESEFEEGLHYSQVLLQKPLYKDTKRPEKIDNILERVLNLLEQYKPTNDGTQL